VISAGMGHTSERTTRVYLAQLDRSVIDKANRKIINL
jgi:site-specific recombinase xerD